RVNSKVLGLLDLSADHPRIVTGVVDPDMVRVTEPRLKRGDNPRRGFTQREITKKGIAAARPVASIRDRTHRDHGPKKKMMVGSHAICAEPSMSFRATTVAFPGSEQVGQPCRCLAFSGLISGFISGYAFEGPYVPLVCARGHQYQVFIGGLSSVDRLLSIEHCQFDLSLIHQLHLPSIKRVEDSLDLMTMILVASSQAGLLLVGNPVSQ